MPNLSNDIAHLLKRNEILKRKNFRFKLEKVNINNH